MKQDENLQIISETLQGISVKKTPFGIIYFKHLSQNEQRDILSQSGLIEAEAIEKGLQHEEDAIKEAVFQEMWSTEKENEIENLQNKINSINSVIGQLKLPSKVKSSEKKVTELQKQLNNILLERAKILGLTCEKYVSNKIQRLTIEKVLFYDKNFKNSVYEDLYINDFDKELEIYKLQKQFFERFSDEKISMAVLSDYFSIYLPFCEDALGVFGQPLKDLTTYQLKLISFGRHFLNIFKNCNKKIPENVAKDPKLLISFYESSREDGKNSGQARSGSGGSTHFGATKEDIDALKAENEDVVDLSKEIKKSGGHLNMQEMMKLHGV
jgi:hypothetical protein